MKRDPAFGPVVVVGAGGGLVELIGDARALFLPVAPDDVEAALRQLKLWPRIARGDVDAVVRAVLAIAGLAPDRGGARREPAARAAGRLRRCRRARPPPRLTRRDWRTRAKAPCPAADDLPAGEARARGNRAGSQEGSVVRLVTIAVALAALAIPARALRRADAGRVRHDPRERLRGRTCGSVSPRAAVVRRIGDPVEQYSDDDWGWDGTRTTFGVVFDHERVARISIAGRGAVLHPRAGLHRQPRRRRLPAPQVRLAASVLRRARTARGPRSSSAGSAAGGCSRSSATSRRSARPGGSAACCSATAGAALTRPC